MCDGAPGAVGMRRNAQAGEERILWPRVVFTVGSGVTLGLCFPAENPQVTSVKWVGISSVRW